MAPPNPARQLTQQEAQHLFSTHAFLLVSGLPARSQISIDGHSTAYLTDADFAGIKLLPPGWHAFVWSLPPTPDGSEDIARMGIGAMGIKNVLLRYFHPGEVAVRRFEPGSEELVIPPSSSSQSSSSHHQSPRLQERKKLRRRLSSSSSPSPIAGQTVASPAYLQDLDSHLLPYPLEAEAKWRAATSHLHAARGEAGKRAIARVVGLQPGSGDAVVDSMATGPRGSEGEDIEVSRSAGASSGRREGGKMIWGKSQPASIDEAGIERFEVLDNDDDEGESEGGAEQQRKRKRDDGPSDSAIKGEAGNDDDEGASDEDEGTLRFTPFDLRRSWPPGATGTQLSRWSRDKSYLLLDVLRRSSRAGGGGGREGDKEEEGMTQLLCEFELAFLLFVHGHNAAAFIFWRGVVEMFALSHSVLGASSGFEMHPSTLSTSPSSTTAEGNEEGWTPPIRTMRLHTAFLVTLCAQLELLPEEFWSDQSSLSAVVGGTAGVGAGAGVEESRLIGHLETLRAAIGRSLSASASVTHSGENVTEGGRDDEAESLVAAWRRLSFTAQRRFGWQLDRMLDEEREVDDDLDAEEGDEAPLVVEI